MVASPGSHWKDKMTECLTDGRKNRWDGRINNKEEKLLEVIERDGERKGGGIRAREMGQIRVRETDGMRADKWSVGDGGDYKQNTKKKTKESR